MSEFKEAKIAGDIGEEEILKLIQNPDHYLYDPDAYIDNTGKANSDWDIVRPRTGKNVEVKNDFKSKFTGNILLEIFMNGKLSALSVTKAEYWVFITGYRYIWIKPIEIYRFLEQHFEYGRTPITGDGDTKEKLAYLVRHDVLVMHIYNNLTKEQGWVDMIGENEVMYYDNFTKTLKDKGIETYD